VVEPCVVRRNVAAVSWRGFGTHAKAHGHRPRLVLERGSTRRQNNTAALD
jgi:hypothetical protein